MQWNCRLLIFSHARAKRGIGAARILIDVEGNESVVWMGMDDLERLLAPHGPHKELQRALALYGLYSKEKGQYDSPALYQRTPEYPYGDQIPRRIRMRRTVTSATQLEEASALLSARMPTVAIIGMDLPVWTNVDGTVSAVFPDGEKLALNAEDFDVLDWDAVKSNADNAV